MGVKISDLPFASGLTGTEVIEAVKDGANVKITPQQIADLVEVSAANAGAAVTIADAGNYFATKNVEAALQTLAARPIGDSALRPDLGVAAPGKGSDLMAARDITAPTYLKTTSDIINGLPVNVRRFMSDQSVFESMLTGVTTYDATAGLQAAFAAYSENRSRRGGRLELGRGRFLCAQSLRPVPYATDNAINLEVVGEGYLATWLDFGQFVRTSSNLDAIVIPNDQQVRFAGFFMLGGGMGATKCRDGLVFGRRAGEGGVAANGVSQARAHDIRVQGFARDGVHHYNTYMTVLEQVRSRGNGRDGFHGDGFHTSLMHVACFAELNGQDPTTYAAERGAGFRFNGMVYSGFLGCGSDGNDYGYVLSNIRGTKMAHCGAEGNQRDGWYVFADNGTVETANPNMVQECYDVRGLSLENCSGYGNNAGNGGYAGLLRVVAANTHTGSGTFGDGSAHKVRVEVRNCDASVVVAGTKAIIVTQTGGGSAEVEVNGDCLLPGGFLASGGARIRNKSLSHRRCIAAPLFDQTIPTAADTPVTFDASATSDDFSGFNPSFPTRVYVPPGASRGRVRAQVGWKTEFTDATSAMDTGSRRMIVRKNGDFANGVNFGRDERDGTKSAMNTTQHTESDIIEVAGGTDYFELLVQHTGGKDLAIRANSTTLSFEVIE